MLADWGAQARWPLVLATLPVKDSVKAKRILTALTTGADKEAKWTQQEKDGALYFSMESAGGFVPVAPVIAVSDHLVIAGLEAASVEAAIKRSGTSSSELANSQNYVNAASALPAPDQAFGYIDTALLYTRFDATLRPMLLMGAMFLPKVAEYVDLSKWPPADVVTKHLSPVVTSTYYKNNGYVTESVGPVTFPQAAVGAGTIVAASVIAYKNQGRLSGMMGTPPAAAPPTTPSVPTPNVSATPTPEETP